MSTDSTSAEFDDLVSAMLLGTLTPEQHARLQDLLLNHPQSQDRYFTHIDIHLALKRQTAIGRQPDPASETAARFPSAASRRRRIGIQLAAWTAATAAVVVVALVLTARSAVDPETLGSTPAIPPPASIPAVEPAVAEAPAVAAEPARPAAVLRQAAGAALVREVVPELGAALATGHEFVLVQGLMELEFAHGAIAIIKAPAVFTVKSADEMELKIGNCSVYAPAGAQGFEVLTPRNRVVDLGTRFSVNVNDVGGSDVQVLEGAAEVHPGFNRRAAALLTQGEASRCTGNSEDLQKIPFNPSQYQRGLPDRVIAYEAEPFQNGPAVRDLANVTVQRGGHVYQYPVQELIGIDVVHFSAYSNKNSAACDGPLPEDVTALLSGDRALNTGLINFDNDSARRTSDGQIEDYRTRNGLAVKFRRPVINGPGPDVVLFEVQSIVYPAEGDHFRVGPLLPAVGLRQHLVDRFDITLNSANAREVATFQVHTFSNPARDVRELTSVTSKRGGNMALPFYALAVGIDLSDLGYPEGSEVDGLFFEDANDNTTVVVDPVFIGGFPAISSRVQ